MSPKALLAALVFVLTLLFASLSGRAQQSPQPASGAERGRALKRAALLEAGSVLVLAGLGTGLIITQPKESFARGFGVGSAVWGGALALQAVFDGIAARRMLNAEARPIGSVPLTSLRGFRWNVALWTLMVGAGVAAAVVPVARGAEGDLNSAGFGTTYVMGGTVFLALASRDLVRAKRCVLGPPPKVTLSGLGFRF